MAGKEEIDKPLRDLIEIIHFTENVGAKIHGVLDEAGIYRIVREEFARSEPYAASILLLTEEGDALRIAGTSVQPGVLAKGERATGLRMEGFRISLEKSRIYSRVVKGGETVETSGGEIIGELFPRPVAVLVAKVMGYERRPAILTPLRRRDEIIGVLAVSSTDLAAYFMPSVRNLAQHLSIALDLADEYAERRRAQEDLRESEEKYRLLVENASEAIIVAQDGLLKFFNPAAIAITRFSAQELAAKPFVELIHPDDRQLVLDRYERRLRGEHPQPVYSFRIIDREGQVKWLEIRGVRITWEGRPATLNLLSEITERKRAEEAVRRRAEELAVLQATVLDITTPHDLPVLLQTIVERAVRLLGATSGGLYLYEPEHEWVRCVVSYNTLRDYSGTILELGEGAAGTVVQTGQPLIIDDYRTWEGRAAVYEQEQPFGAVLSVPMIWQGQVTGVLHVLAEAGERRFSENDLELLKLFGNHATIAVENARLRRDLEGQMEQLRRAQAQLVQSAKLAAVGEMAAGLAHELNNPLTSILGYTELFLEEVAPGDRSRGDLERVIAETQRARDIVQNLFNFSRQTKPEREPADVNVILQRAVAVVRYQMETAGVVVEEEYAQDLPPLLLDVGQMSQVFLNLIRNGLQAMPERGRLSVRTARVGEEVAVSISDTGVGIPARIWERIFEPFFSTEQVGVGMGLPVSQGVVREHGGRITVDSEEGRGSTFTVWLPIEGQQERDTP